MPRQRRTPRPARNVEPSSGERLAHRRRPSIAGPGREVPERRPVEEALRETEERFRRLHETALHGIVYQDADGTILSLNPAARRILGQPEAQVLGSSSVGQERWCIHEDGSPFPAAEHPAMVALRTGQVVRGVVMGVYNPEQARHRWIDITAVPLLREGETRPYQVYTLFDDVTERRDVATAVRRYELLASHTRDVVIFVRREDGRILEANTAALSAYGYGRDELLSRSIEDLRAPATRALTRQQMAEADREGILFETEHLRKDGTTFPVEVSSRGATVDGIRVLLSVVRDITDRKRAEEALRESETRYRALFEQMMDGFAYHGLIVDRHGRPFDYVFLEANDAFERLTGLKREETLGRSAREVLPGIEAEPADWIGTYGAVALSGQPIRFEQYSQALDKWYVVSAYSPKRGYFATVFEDVTDRKRNEETLRRANLRLAEADERKNDFLAMLSHELRNPLAPIRNSLYVLERAAPAGEPARHAQAVIARQVDHMARLVDDLLDVTRITRGKVQVQREPLELGELVRRTVEDHRSLFARSGVALSCSSAAGGALWASGDRTRLSQVIGNLLQNAAKFTPPGGSVEVRLERSGAGQAALRIRDTGAGIEPGVLPRLFQPFMQAETTLDRSRGGLGLGLALVKGLVEQHGGTVEVASGGPGKGAEFTIALPLIPTEHAGRVPEEGPAPEGRARRVLIVEDNVDAADSLRDAVKLMGHTAEVAYRGPDGLEKARAFRPEVVLCDIGLPGMDGYQVASALRADPELAAATLVALTGYASPADVARALQSGFDRHMAKPPDFAELERILGHAGARLGGSESG